MKKTIAAICGVVLLTLGAYFLWPKKSAQVSAGAAAGPANSAVAVSVIPVRSQKVDLFEELPGRVVAFEVAEIRPQVTGIITERLFQEGSRVEQGQQLYQIDPSPYQAAYQSAQADLAKAQADVKSIQAKANRYETLVEIDAVSRQEFDDVTAGLAQAQADVAIAESDLTTAKIDLDYTKVYAPISGQIGKSLFTKGALVTANQPQYLAMITKLDPIYVDLVQPSAKLSRMRQSFGRDSKLEVELTLESASQPYPHRGELQFADVTVDPSTGSVQLRALFPNPDGILLPGMFVRARLKTESVEGILVSQRATTRGPDGTLSVWVVNSENKVEKRTVRSEKAVDGAWLITDGLESGETIVLEGVQKLQPGARVEPTPVPNPNAAESTSEKEQN